MQLFTTLMYLKTANVKISTRRCLLEYHCTMLTNWVLIGCCQFYSANKYRNITL